MVEIVWQLMMATGLAACAGLRAFVPLLVVGVAGRYEMIELTARTEWLESTPALTVFVVAVALEILADKVPFIDHALDVLATFARPVAGAIVAVSPLTSLDPLLGVVVGVVLGGGVAGGVHAAKSTLRVASTGATGGVANPALSAGEDVATLLGSLVSLFLPIVTFTLAIGLLYVLAHSVRKRKGRASRPVTPPGGGAPFRG